MICPSSVTAGQLGNWTTLNYLNVSRMSNISVLAYDTIIFTLGGFTYTTTPYPVEKTIIYPDGTLSSWVIDSQTMKKARCAPVGFYYNGYVYTFGGDAGPNMGVTSTAERAKGNSDGTLGQWEYINPLPKWLFEASLILSPPYVYIIGGWNVSTEYSTEVFRSKIQPDGSLSNWTLSTSNLLVGRRRLSSILIDSTIYVTGGYCDSTSDTRNIECANIYPDGELGPFSIKGQTKPYHSHPAMFYDGKYLNIIGGWNGGGYFNYRGERVLVNADGSLGEPELASPLANEKGGFGYVQASMGGYVIGGNISDVQYVPFLAPTEIDKKYWEVMK